jgi:asparagine synthase (glutamine-hydrolysing)
MCGIYGITQKNEKFIQSYIDACSHRGPDGQGIWSSDKITLGHNLLSITDQPTNSKQPWITPHGNILIYNGEIFNYPDLIIKYTDFNPRTTCDTELLAWGLDHYGIDFIDHIDSMHGFAYYNINKNELILSRDHAGIKPVYYAEIACGIVFGSEIKGMLDIVPNSRKIDPMALACLSLTGINATKNTFFSNIKKLLAGETLVYDVSNKKIKHMKRNIITATSTKKLSEEEFCFEANQTVKMCTLGMRKIGVFLSGGLDSSLIAHELKKITGEANTFTNRMEPHVAVPGEDYNDDARCASLLANYEGYNHKEVLCTPDIIIKYWNDSIKYIEQPMYNPSLSMYYYTNHMLANDGVVVTMAGDMGDELLGGYPKYWHLKNGKWGTILNHSELIRVWMTRIKRPIKLKNSLVSTDDIHKELCKSYPENIFNGADVVNSYMALDCITQVPEDFFNRNDKYGMAHSMEGRFPLATKKFMRYCLDIHSNYKIGNTDSQTKLPTKKSYKGKLHDCIITKSKTGWTAPLAYWMFDHKHAGLLKMYYEYNQGEKSLISNQKTAKSIIPQWILKDWIKKYDMSF